MVDFFQRKTNDTDVASLEVGWLPFNCFRPGIPHQYISTFLYTYLLHIFIHSWYTPTWSDSLIFSPPFLPAGFSHPHLVGFSFTFCTTLWLRSDFPHHTLSRPLPAGLSKVSTDQSLVLLKQTSFMILEYLLFIFQICFFNWFSLIIHMVRLTPPPPPKKKTTITSFAIKPTSDSKSVALFFEVKNLLQTIENFQYFFWFTSSDKCPFCFVHLEFFGVFFFQAQNKCTTDDSSKKENNIRNHLVLLTKGRHYSVVYIGHLFLHLFYLVKRIPFRLAKKETTDGPPIN